MNIIVGATGILGSAILRSLGETTCITLPRQKSIQWLNSSVNGIRQDLLKFLDSSTSADIDLYYALGNTNPKADPNILNELNFFLPERILKASLGLPVRVITFGSIHELSGISNPYMDSKRNLARLLTEQSHVFNSSHFLLHTLYSDTEPRSHMLLGQILNSIRLRQTLKMSSGLQLRQYHHVDDVVKVIAVRLSSNISVPSQQVNGPETLQIRDLASNIYKEFECLPLLKLNSLPEGGLDVYDAKYPIPEWIRKESFRSTFNGVLTAFKNFLK